MPRIMHAYSPVEIVVTADTTHILIEHIHDSRRIHTDGRGWPEDMDANPMFAGYSIGKWIDEDGDGRYDVLVVETRGLKNPRTYDASGIPFHEDGRTIIKEKIYLDKADPSLLHDEITTIDNALTRPWTVVKNYRRVVTNKPIWWREDICAENNVHVVVGKEDYFLSADGFLMPIKKDLACIPRLQTGLRRTRRLSNVECGLDECLHRVRLGRADHLPGSRISGRCTPVPRPPGPHPSSPV